MGTGIDTVAILGSTSWGLTLAHLFSELKDCSVKVWARSDEEAQQMSNGQFKRDWLPPNKGVFFSHSAEEVFDGADLVIISVPSHDFITNLSKLRDSFKPEMLVLSASKGIEQGSGLTMSAVTARELPQIPRERIGALSGPNLAHEVAQGCMAFTTVAFTEIQYAELVQKRLYSDIFRVYSTNDLVGVEVGGAYKNILAMSAGYLDALEVGINVKAALLTRGLYEMAKYGMLKGGRRETFAGLSGLGDLLASCYSSLSRNYQFGNWVGKGDEVDVAQQKVIGIIEGINTVKSVVEDANRLGLELPIAEVVNGVIHTGTDPHVMIGTLFGRDVSSEFPV